MGNEELANMFAQNSTKEDLNFIARFFRRFIDAIKKVFGDSKKYQQYVYDAKKLLGVFERAVKNYGNKKASGGEETRSGLVGFAYDGTEIYETSDETKKLSYSDRIKQFINLMTNQYRGRTAKFIRNGHAYYARFEDHDVSKNIYGDKRSDKSGQKAKINTGADGDIFTLAENSTYSGSGVEQGKTNKAHKGVLRWDYFVKRVQIDGRVFDVVANIRKTADEQFVYSLQLNENKKIKPSPLVRTTKSSLNASAQQLYDNSISHSDEIVKSKSALSSKPDATSSPANKNSVFDDKQRKFV